MDLSSRPFVPPAIADFDLFYYLPGYPTRLLAASTEMPIVGNALTLTGSEYDNVQETAYVTKGGPSWSPGTAYVSADLDSVPTEILCYFKTGASVVSLPTIAITSDTTGTIPFWHLYLDATYGAFVPQFSYNAPPLTSVDMQWGTQEFFGSLSANTWYVYRAQQRGGYESRITVESTAGTVLGEFYGYSANLARHLSTKCFIELFGNGANDIQYGFFGARSAAKTSYAGWASMGFVAAASMLSAPGSGWGASLFGGSATHDATNKEWDIAAANYGEGGAYSVGPVTSGDVVEVWGKLNSMTSAMGSMEVALAYPYGVGSNEVQITSTGTFHATLTATTTNSNMQVILGGRSGETSAAFAVQDILIMKNKASLPDHSTSNPV